MPDDGMSDTRDDADALLHSVAGDAGDEAGTISHDELRRIARGRDVPSPITPAFLGFSSDLVMAGATMDIVRRPQLLCRFSRLYVTAESMDFAIHDIRFGAYSIFLSYGDVPAEAFVGQPLRGELLDRVRMTLAQGHPDIVTVPPGLRADFSMFGDVVPGNHVALVGMDVMIRVKNRRNVPCSFRAVLFGEALQP